MKSTFNPFRALRPAMMAALVLLAVTAVQADLKIAQSTTMDMSKMVFSGQPMSDQMKATIQHLPVFASLLGSTTTYVKGTKVRIELANVIEISDLSAETITSLNVPDKTYWTSPIPKAKVNAPGANVKPDIKPLGTTQQLLGHTCLGYEMTMTGVGIPITFDATFWAASDLSMPVGATTGNAQIDAFRAKINGYPLKMEGHMTSDVFGTATLTMTVTSISTDSLPDDLFAPPADYTKIDAPQPGSGAWSGMKG